MGFKTCVFVLCLLATQSLGANKNHRRHHVKKSDSSVRVRLTERRVDSSLRLRPSVRGAEHSKFCYDFNKIKGGEGVKIAYDNSKNAFAAVNTKLGYAAVADGVNGLLGILNLQSGALMVINLVTGLGSVVTGLLGNVTDLVANLLSEVGTLGAGLIKTLNTLLSVVQNNVNNLVFNVVDLLNSVLNTTLNTLNGPLGPILRPVYAAFRPLLNAVAGLVDGVNKGVAALLEPLLGTIDGLSTAVTGLLATVFRTTNGLFDGTVFEAINKEISNIVFDVVDGVVGGVRQVTKGVFGLLNGVLSGVGGIFTTIDEALTKRKEGTGYCINTETVKVGGDAPVAVTYANNNKTEDWFAQFVKMGVAPADLVMLYKHEFNFLGFFNKRNDCALIMNGNTGHMGIFDVTTGAGFYIPAQSKKAYLIDPSTLVSNAFSGPNAKSVKDSLELLNTALINFADDLKYTVDTLFIDLTAVLETLVSGRPLSALLSGDTLVKVSRLLNNLLTNLVGSIRPLFKPLLGTVNVILGFVVNLPFNISQGIIDLVANILDRLTGLFTGKLMGETFKLLAEGVLNGVKTLLFGPLIQSLGLVNGVVGGILNVVGNVLENIL